MARQIINNSPGTADSLKVGADKINGMTAELYTADAAAGTASLRTLGTGAQQATAGNDARLSDQRTPLDGSVTTDKIADQNVTAPKLSFSAGPRFMARAVPGAGPGTEITAAQLTAALDTVTRSAKGLAPAAGGTTGTTKFLREDSQWAVPSTTGGSSVYYNLVTDGGLVPGGATDNTVAFQNAAAAAATAGLPMWLPEGEFLLNDAVIQLGSSVPEFRLYGPGTFVYALGDGAFSLLGEWGSEIPITSFTPISDADAATTPTFTTVGVGSVSSLTRNDIVKLYCDSRYTYTDLNGDAPFIAETHPIISVDSGANTFRIPLFFEGGLFNTATNQYLRKMIPRTVIIDGPSVRALGNIFTAPPPTRRPAITLTGLVRPEINMTIISANQIGIRDESSYCGNYNVRFIELWNGQASSVFGYGYQARYGCTGSRYSYTGNTGRHLFTTDFDDSGDAYDPADYFRHGACFHLTIENGISYGATGVAFDTHEFCYYPVFSNCRVYKSFNLLAEGDGVACFSHRAFAPTYTDCIAVGGTNGFQDTSAQYAYGHTTIRTSAPLQSEAGVARYIGCYAIGQSSGQGFTLGAAAAAFASPQSAQSIFMQNCHAHGSNYGFQTNAATNLIMDGCSSTACISGPGRWISGVAGTMNHVFRNCTFDYTGLSSTATGWRNSSTTVRLNVDIDGLVVRGSTSRPATAAFEFGSTPVALNFEARRVVFFDRSAPIRILAATGGGSIPSGSRIFIPDGGAGPEIAYGTQVDVGDAGITPTNNSTPTTLVWNTPLTANRAITLTTTNARKGDKYKFARTKAATGAFVLEVLSNSATGFNNISLTAGGPGATVEFDGTLWQQIG